MRITCVVAAAGAFCLVAGPLGMEAQGPSELRVRSGETLTIDTGSLAVRVDTWVMEDNSTIEIPPDVCGRPDCTWTIHADNAVFGSGVRILGVGRHGSHGTQAGASGADAPGRGNDGGLGGAGSHGEDGGHGVSVTISMGIASLQDLLIDVRGGDGGNGVTGGSGGHGSRGGCTCNCRGGRGGNGGPGGRAGSGGNGGNIAIDYWRTSAGPVGFGDLRHNVDPGDAGSRGQGGSPGAGGGGSGNCGIWPYYRRGGGASGSWGEPGASGSPGISGDFRITERQL